VTLSPTASTRPGNFVTRHARILKPGPETFFDQCIAVANAACFDLHAHLAGTWFGNVAFDEFPIATGFAYLCCLHFHAH
jgi:hypothetical protein